MKLMIVDDEPLEREVLTMMIKKHNLNVSHFFEAQNGRDAVKLAKEEKVDLVIMDIKMPVMDGLTAAELIKKETPDCRVIFLTAYDEFDYAYRTIKLGADDYLLKPAHPDDIKQALAKFIPVRSERDSTVLTGNYKSEDIKRVVDYIEANLHQELTLHTLAHLVHLNAQYLSRLFKQETGHTLTSFITIRRIEKAKQYFHHTKDTISEISERCGFSDPNYFTRVFKKYVGLTPTQYQQQSYAGEKRRMNSFGKFLM